MPRRRPTLYPCVLIALLAWACGGDKAALTPIDGTSPGEIDALDTFSFAEDYHQQYLAKNPNGYCGLGGTGVACQIGTGIAAE